MLIVTLGASRRVGPVAVDEGAPVGVSCSSGSQPQSQQPRFPTVAKRKSIAKRPNSDGLVCHEPSS